MKASPLPDDIRRSLVVLVVEPQITKAEELAVDLLTRGCVDVVLIDNDWPKHLTELMGNHSSLGSKKQLLVIFKDQASWPGNSLPTGGHSALLKVDSWSGLRNALNFEGIRTV